MAFINPNNLDWTCGVRCIMSEWLSSLTCQEHGPMGTKVPYATGNIGHKECRPLDLLKMFKLMFHTVVFCLHSIRRAVPSFVLVEMSIVSCSKQLSRNRNVLVCFPRFVLRHNPVSELYGQFLRPRGLVFALTCTVNCGTLYRQVCAFPNHVQSSCRNIKDDQWKQDAPELNFECHS
jgi:hypothetical protein